MDDHREGSFHFQGGRLLQRRSLGKGRNNNAFVLLNLVLFLSTTFDQAKASGSDNEEKHVDGVSEDVRGIGAEADLVAYGLGHYRSGKDMKTKRDLDIYDHKNLTGDVQSEKSESTVGPQRILMPKTDTSGRGKESRKLKNQTYFDYVDNHGWPSISLEDFKSRISAASNFSEIFDIIRDSGLELSHEKRTSQSKKTKSFENKRKYSSPAIQKTCSKRNILVVDEFNPTNDRSQRRSKALSVCGPYHVNNTKNKHSRSSEQVDRVNKYGLCKPVEMMIDVEPEERDPYDTRGPSLMIVRRCNVILRPENTSINISCVATKKKRKEATFEDPDDPNKRRGYAVYDHLACATNISTNESSLEKKGVSKQGRVVKKRCPWPFELNKSESRCVCLKRNLKTPEGKQYLDCKRVQRDLKQRKSIENRCNDKGRCLTEVCPIGSTYNKKQRKCVLRSAAATHLAATELKRHRKIKTASKSVT